MNRGAQTLVVATLLVVTSCQQMLPQQTEPNSGQIATGFMPMNSNSEDRRTTSSATATETSSAQSRDYSGGSEFYGYNYPASYGPPSSSYGSSGKSKNRTRMLPTEICFTIRLHQNTRS